MGTEDRAADIRAVRHFNRTVTQRIGALDEDYLARRRPLGASRLLWEIGEDGTETLDLRRRLGLDSGYLSRLLRRLETEGLVTIGAADTDQRVRRVTMTAAGRRERRVLDERSDEIAEALLAPLDERRRAALVEAMATVDRLLTAAAVTIAAEDPASADATACLDAYYAELDRRFDGGFDVRRARSATPDELVEPHGLLLVARLHGQPIGCGALKLHGTAPAEIKRMWVSGDARGLGVGRRLLTELERAAAARGVRTVQLETNRSLGEAIELYRSAGYREIPAWNDEVYGDHWFEKDL
jgi:DNA-binding MarR family transcriptional regulator/N-acetylglutamate synthase-like GNAT family acetyltransferase